MTDTHRIALRIGLLTLAALWGLGCGAEPAPEAEAPAAPPAAPGPAPPGAAARTDPPPPTTPEEALASLELAPERVRKEVLKTCDKWRHIDRECHKDEARREQLECWIEKGHPFSRLRYVQRMRPRGRDSSIMLRQNLCMELRRWRKLKRGPDF